MKVLEFYCISVKRVHSELKRIAKLGDMLSESVSDEKTKAKLKDIARQLNVIHETMEKIVNGYNRP